MPSPRDAAVRGARATRAALVQGYTSPAPRRLLPLRVAFRAIDVWAARARHTEAPLYRETRDFHRELLRHTPRAGEEDDVAERTLAEVLRCLEIFWRPWLVRRGGMEGRERYEGARGTRRGIIAVFPRFGIASMAAPIMRRHGVDTWAVVAPHHYSEETRGFQARYAHRAAWYFEDLGPGHVIVRDKEKGGTFEQSLALLREGRTIATAFDVPGSMRTPFLGRTIALASGPVKLAAATDALIVPFMVPRRGDLPVVHWGPVLDPRDHADPASLQAALAGVVAEWAVGSPELVWPVLAEPGGPPLIHEAPPEPAVDAPAASGG